MSSPEGRESLELIAPNLDDSVANVHDRLHWVDFPVDAGVLVRLKGLVSNWVGAPPRRRTRVPVMVATSRDTSLRPTTGTATGTACPSGDRQTRRPPRSMREVAADSAGSGRTTHTAGIDPQRNESEQGMSTCSGRGGRFRWVAWREPLPEPKSGTVTGTCPRVRTTHRVLAAVTQPADRSPPTVQSVGRASATVVDPPVGGASLVANLPIAPGGRRL